MVQIHVTVSHPVVSFWVPAKNLTRWVPRSFASAQDDMMGEDDTMGEGW